MFSMEGRELLNFSMIRRLVQTNSFGRRMPRRRLSLLFMGLACLGQMLAVTPALSATGKAAPSPAPSPTPTAEITVYDVALRVHAGASVRWKPSFIVNFSAASCSIIQPPSHGNATCADVLVPQPGRYGMYTPAAGFVGQDSFTYQLTDPLLGTTSRVAAVTVSVVAPCTGSGCYMLTPLDTNSEEGQSVYIEINNRGSIVSAPYYWPSISGRRVSLQDQLVSSLGHGFVFGNNYHMNNNGQIPIPWSGADSGGSNYGIHHVVLDADTGNIRFVDSLGRMEAINDRGNLLGQLRPYPYPGDSFLTSTGLWDAQSGNTIDLRLQPGWPASGDGVKLNNVAQVLGRELQPPVPPGIPMFLGFVWDPVNGKTPLGTLADAPLGFFSYAPQDINDRMEVVGGIVFKEAFLWRPSDGMRGLGYLGGNCIPGASDRSFAASINSTGMVVGASTGPIQVYNYGRPQGECSEAFRWTDVAGMQALWPLLDASGKGWDLQLAKDINDSGQIAGVGVNPGGQTQAFVLSPLALGLPNNVAPTANDTKAAGATAWPLNWTPAVIDTLGDPLTCRIDRAPTSGKATVANDCSLGTYVSNADFIGTDSFTVIANDGRTDSNPGAVAVSIVLPTTGLEVLPTEISGTSAMMISWKPVINTNLLLALPSPVCSIKSPPSNGAASIAPDCTNATYESNPGFVGIDSFEYEASICTDRCYPGPSATVTVSVTEGSVDQICAQNNPVSQFTQIGREGTVTIRFTGNITAHTDKVVKVCPGTTLKYQATSTQGPVVCHVKNNTTRGSGSLKINDHIKCTDKPAGKDMVGFKVKSGVR